MLAAVVAALWALLMPAPAPGRPVGLFTTLPLLWAEQADPAAVLAGDAPPHPAREVLAAGGTLIGLDRLDAGSLAPLELAVLAQPRALSPDENVAFDGWVRGGGSALILADPMLTQPSELALGDPRRPQGTVMLSPLLGHWGLRLSFDEGQAAGLHGAAWGGAVVPVDLNGSLASTGPECRIEAGGLIARCRIGAGHALVLADAAVLDPAAPGQAEALGALLREARAD